MKRTLYKTITFLNGDTCDVHMPTLGDFSRAVEKYNEAKKTENEEDNLDINPYVMEQICTFNGQKKDINFISGLSGDVFFKVQPVINELMNLTI